MDITPAIPRGRQLIHSYGDGGFRVAEQRHEGAILILPDRTLPWRVAAFGDITVESLEPLRGAAEAVQILLLGCGPSIAFVRPALRQTIRDWGIVVEPMDTGAACRTYNVLLSEERRVAAALLPV